MKWVYNFTEGNRDMAALLGGKGANLAEMSRMGIPVPPGLTVTAEACLEFQKRGSLDKELKAQVSKSLKEVEQMTGKTFGDQDNPLLLSIRSGARVSMPGMMDTILNLGLNEESVKGLANVTSNERFAWDSYRRFIQMYANVVMGFETTLLETTLEDLKEARGVTEDTELHANDLAELTSVFKKMILQESGNSFPADPHEQLWKAIAAVFNSWNNERAMKYRELNGIPHDWGTAVNIQAMVFGNMGDDSATGVCFTRNPSDGEKQLWGEYLLNAQGEDVVAGVRTPAPINDYSKNDSNNSQKTLAQLMPECYDQLRSHYKKLEGHYKDMQDIEFTIEKGRLFILQTRNGKRTAAAAIKIATDLVREKVLTKREALLKVKPEDIGQLLHPQLDHHEKKTVLAKGLPASPGAASGKIAFTPNKAQTLSQEGDKVILVRKETSPEDIAGMAASEGILTCRGGMTSHAAVVARGMGKPCVAGCSGVIIDSQCGVMSVNGKTLREGDFLTIDGGSGEVLEGQIPTVAASLSGNFLEFMKWTDHVGGLSVRTNADNPNDAQTAIKFGACGIGLCRTEHMFFEPERVLAVREMIFAKNAHERKNALDKLLPFQREDFAKIFRVMDGRPVNIRLLDPPLHEFLPHDDKEKTELAIYLKRELKEIVVRGEKLQEFNPMLGHRGCRLGITFPEIYAMQARAIIEASLQVQQEGIEVRPEIMVPLIAIDNELKIIKQAVVNEIEAVLAMAKANIPYKIGTMIELPRAAITARKIAAEAEFFSFGTNDLTQTTFGISRDDAGKFLPDYAHQEILPDDPFVALDRQGVGFLVEHATCEGRKGNPNLHLGLCGEHGGDPDSITFCHRIGLDYVSCSPFRVPIAKLAAAQAAIAQ